MLRQLSILLNDTNSVDIYIYICRQKRDIKYECENVKERKLLYVW